MSLPRIGDSLDPAKSLAVAARSRRFPDVVCDRCLTNPFPRGYCPRLRLCWTCVFPTRNEG